MRSIYEKNELQNDKQGADDLEYRGLQYTALKFIYFVA
jgi:hypothetical protein